MSLISVQRLEYCVARHISSELEVKHPGLGLKSDWVASIAVTKFPCTSQFQTPHVSINTVTSFSSITIEKL